MKHWDAIRLEARKRHHEALKITGGDSSAEALLSAAESMTGIPRQGLHEGHRLLYKSKAVLHSRQVWFNNSLDPWEQQFNQIHEYAHHWRHGEGSFCGEADFDWGASEDSVKLGVKRVDGYSPHERRELEANVFAREFLLPEDRLRELFLDGKNAEDIAIAVGMPIGMVVNQLTRALLGVVADYPDLDLTLDDVSEDFILDDSQTKAAHAGWKEENPRAVLVDAGPGTGKTRTLVGRIVHLLNDRGIQPSRILALTYSNKAAEEMYSRVRAAVSQDTTHIWMGTFHSFGLELIRKYHDRLGLPAKPEIIDPMDAQLMLERSLGRLELRHYRSLTYPAASLPSILSAISRAKDELISPKEYERLAREELDAAEDDEKLRRKAERAIEVARAYGEYEKLLREKNYLDYGDLIMRAVELLEGDADLRSQLQEKYEHILVDEYQDVNTGSRVLLKLLARDGRGLWVVGDLRQAIYRFRGASPVNMRLLTTKDFPDAQLIPLRVNYRSQRTIVRLFELCAGRMRATVGRTSESWEIDRIEIDGGVRYKVSSNEEAEAEEMVEEIERLREIGIEFRNQAVLCRQHDALSKYSQALERAGIPVLYLGNFFERPEVRDLLSIISMAGEGDGRALFRLAQFKEYEYSFKDAKALTRYSYERNCFFPEAMKYVPEVEGVSSEGRKKLALLAEHFKDCNFATNPWGVLAQYLFVKSNYLRELARDESVQAQQKRLAIYQFLLLTYQLRDRFTEEQGDQKRHFLNYMRRLKLNNEERQLRQTPDWADEIDAVRMLTIHSSKGLEFSAVHLPGLGERQFPRSPIPDKCPPPVGMLSNEMLDWHMEEEECLFFVGLSRARDHLCVSRARQYKNKDSRESLLLGLVRGLLPNAVVKPLARPPQRIPEPDKPMLRGAPSEFSDVELSVYLACPLEYYYRYILRISDHHSDTAYSQSHLCVHRVWRQIEDELQAGRSIDQETVSAMFDKEWEEVGPKDHPYKEDYREEAVSMVERTLDYSSASRARMLSPKWRVKLKNGDVIVRPDYAEVLKDDSGTQLLIQEMCFGPPPSKPPYEHYHALYDAAAAYAHPGARVRIQSVYMSNGDVVDVTVTQSNRKASLGRYEAAIIGIKRGEFEARPEDRRCPYCPCFFICPAAEELEDYLAVY